jgi:hypothetical protein
LDTNKSAGRSAGLPLLLDTPAANAYHWQYKQNSAHACPDMEVIMRRRLYFLLPDLRSARQVVDDLLLARVEARHIHVLARRGTDLGELPEANVFQKTDLVHGAQVGGVAGALLGALAGLLLLAFPPGGLRLAPVAVLAMVLIGALFGVWVASLIGAGVPNSRLRQFRVWIEQGKLLLMVDVPFSQRERLTELVRRRHPEAVPGGTEPTIPAFP